MLSFGKKIPVYFISIGIILGIFSGFSWKGNVRIRNSRGIKIEILRKSIDLIQTWYDEKLIVQNSDIYPIAIEAIFNPDKVYKGLNIKYKIIKTIQKSKDSMYNSKNDTYMWFTIPYTFFEFIYEFTKYHLEVQKK